MCGCQNNLVPDVSKTDGNKLKTLEKADSWLISVAVRPPGHFTSMVSWKDPNL